MKGFTAMTEDFSSDSISKWAKRIAAEIEPESEALAPMMMEAYLRGGRDRRQLFENKAELGGFLPDGGALLLPFAYMALSYIAKGLLKLYQSGGLSGISNLLSIWKNAFDLIKTRKAREEAHAVTETEARRSLRHTLDEVQRALREQGLSTDQCELICYRVMMVLLDEPIEGAQLVRTFQSESA